MLKFEVIDLFSGAGGVTTGIEQATYMGKKIANVICAINHDDVAIESHKKNHPHVKHFTEDIRTFNVKRLPKASVSDDVLKFLWASTECTNLSNAKGGLSRDADSRTLAEHLPPYIKEFDPDYIGIENVKEFREWGPLVQKVDKEGNLMFDKNNKPYMVPDKAKKGIDYNKWLIKICSLGYHYEERILNAADFGAYTSRRRLFIIFAKEWLPITWPKPTHDKNESNIFGLPKWKPVKDVLNFEDKGENIFGRKKNLCEKTYQRIYAGLLKYIAKGDESFITKYLGNNEHTGINNGKSINDPSITISTQNRVGLVQAEFLLNYHHSSDVNDTEGSCPTLTTHDKLGVVQTEFLMKYHGHGKNILSTEEPASTLSTKDRLGLVSAHFIDMQHGSGKQSESIEEPCGAILPVVKKNLVTINQLSFIDQQFGESKPSSIEEPCNTLTANPKYNLVQAYLMNTQYNNIGRSLDQPAPTLLASRRHPYLIQLETGEIVIRVEKEDTEAMRKIKIFMAAFGIVAIYMRMLRENELKKITGFNENYILLGTSADRKKFIGNAVPPVLPQVMFEALYQTNLEQRLKFKKVV